jgi:hypothetical protein
LKGEKQMKGVSTMDGLLHKSGLWLKRSSPTILTCIGAVGVAATAILAVKATPKALAILDEATAEYSANGRTSHTDVRKLPKTLPIKETIRLTWKCYIPAAAVGASTIICIFGANILNKRNQASLVSAYALLNESYQKYRKAANEVYGTDADSKIKAEMAKETYVSADGYGIYYPNFDEESAKVLFWDSFSQRYFTTTMASVINAQYHINRNLELRGGVSLNEFYDFLGIDHIKGGDDLGWSMDDLMEGGIMWLDFENMPVKMDDGLECYVMSSMFEPSLYNE